MKSIFIATLTAIDFVQLNFYVLDMFTLDILVATCFRSTNLHPMLAQIPTAQTHKTGICYWCVGVVIFVARIAQGIRAFEILHLKWEI